MNKAMNWLEGPDHPGVLAVAYGIIIVVALMFAVAVIGMVLRG